MILAGLLSDCLNENQLRLERETELMGRELVTSAANGDVHNCRLILERARRFKANQESAEELTTGSHVLAPKPTTIVQNCTRPSNSEDIVLTNFVSSGHTSLQAAAQNGHVDVCRLLVGEFGADIEFQVH